MAAILTREQIESVVSALPIQTRVMVRLLFLQFLDIDQEDIDYMAADRPDPRMQQGQKTIRKTPSRDAIRSVADRCDQYLGQTRQKRERTWLQIECLQKQMALSETLSRVAEQVLADRFGYDRQEITNLKNTAQTAVPRPAIRTLDKQWAKDEVTEEEYRKERLPIEYQTELRRLQRFRRRLESARKELAMMGSVPLQDHEIAHIWGIPMGSLAARKVKALHLFLTNLQAKIQEQERAAGSESGDSVDLWKESFATLSTSPVQRSVAVYDGLEGTETVLVDKLNAFATGSMTEEVESRFWQTISRDYSPNAVEGQGKRQSLFALQRLYAILSETDCDMESLEQDLLNKVSPTPKLAAGEAPESVPEPVPQLGEMAEHVLRSFRGEDR